MCRLVAYSGPAIPLQNLIALPVHSLLHQSMAAQEALVTVNGDGFGVSWYGADAEPGRFTDVMPAWSDQNLKSLCRLVHSRLFLAHVRASTAGETSRANCHPFVFDQWSFMHNGHIPHFDRIRRRLESELPDSIYCRRRGTTDSEIFFFLMLAYGASENVQNAWNRAMETVLHDHSDVDGPVRMACVLSDGQRLFAFRFSTDDRSPSLYYSGKLDNGGFAFASEPLEGCVDRWQLMPEHSYAVIDNGALVRGRVTRDEYMVRRQA
jgi:glutamine amidotransferase